MTAVLLFLIAAGESSASQDAAARSKYESVFGAKDRAATSTSSTQDDAEFAAELLKAAGSLSEDPGLVTVVYQRAFELGAADSSGYATALTAAKMLREADEAAADDWDSKVLALHRVQYRRAKGPQKLEAGKKLIAALDAGAAKLSASHQYAEAIEQYKEGQTIATALREPEADEFKQKVKLATDRRLALDKIEKAKALIAKAPDATKSKQIAESYLLDLDDPAAAAEFALAAGDATYKQMIPLATTPVKKIGEEDLLRLAEWYDGLAGATTLPARKAVALKRAADCYLRFVNMHAAQDGDRLKATARVGEISKSLNSLAGAAGLYTADRLVIWNQYNGMPWKDRGTNTIDIILTHKGDVVWSKKGVTLPWVPGEDANLIIDVPRITFDRVRVEILAWHKSGGGLAEIEVYRGKRNIARGAKVTVSSSFDASWPGSRLTDGITSSKKTYEGYWILPNDKKGWAEVDVSSD